MPIAPRRIHEGTCHPCSHGPLAHAGLCAAAHPGSYFGLRKHPKSHPIPTQPPHGPTAHGYNASRIGAVILSLGIILFATSICRAAPAVAKLVPALGWDVSKQGGFAVSLASDASGNIWVGTEGNGVWKYNPSTRQWTQFTTKDGLGDDCVYALAVDRQNRVWAGHL